MASAQTAVVTGAGSGIGQACAVGLARQGYRVAVADVRPDASATTAAMIHEQGGEALSLAVDVSDSASVQRGFDRIVGQWGGVKVLVNNAGIVHQSLMEHLSDEDWHRVLDVNLTGMFYMARAAIPLLRADGSGGRIVNISSVLSTVTRPLNGPYSASKGGVNAMTRALALELAPSRITVNAVAPGHILTPLTVPMFTPAVTRAFEERIPLGYLGQAEWIADAVLFLVSPEAHYITGQVLFVDGGYNINGDLPNLEFGR